MEREDEFLTKYSQLCRDYGMTIDLLTGVRHVGPSDVTAHVAVLRGRARRSEETPPLRSYPASPPTYTRTEPIVAVVPLVEKPDDEVPIGEPDDPTPNDTGNWDDGSGSAGAIDVPGGD